MRIWKILKEMKLIAYVQVTKDCKICDDGYAALQLVRKKLNDFCIDGTQLIDVERGEQMQECIPRFLL